MVAGRPDPMKIGLLGGSGQVGRSVVRARLASGDDVVHEVVLLNRRVIGRGTVPEGDSRLVQRERVVRDARRAAVAGQPPIRQHAAIAAYDPKWSRRGPYPDLHHRKRLDPGQAANLLLTHSARRVVAGSIPRVRRAGR
jgi:nucleoside-diphosphate-sugar epimerase